MATKTGYSLGFLFLITAVVAVLFTLLRISVATFIAGDTEWEVFLASSVVTGICAMVLGGIVGLYHYRPLTGVLMGAGIGFWTGCAAGPLLLVSTENAGALILSQLGGAVLLIIVSMALSRSGSGRTCD